MYPRFSPKKKRNINLAILSSRQEVHQEFLTSLTRFMTPFSDKRNRRSQCMTW